MTVISIVVLFRRLKMNQYNRYPNPHPHFPQPQQYGQQQIPQPQQYGQQQIVVPRELQHLGLTPEQIGAMLQQGLLRLPQQQQQLPQQQMRPHPQPYGYHQQPQNPQSVSPDSGRFGTGIAPQPRPPEPKETIIMNKPTEYKLQNSVAGQPVSKLNKLTYKKPNLETNSNVRLDSERSATSLVAVLEDMQQLFTSNEFKAENPTVCTMTGSYSLITTYYDVDEALLDGMMCAPDELQNRLTEVVKSASSLATITTALELERRFTQRVNSWLAVNSAGVIDSLATDWRDVNSAMSNRDKKLEEGLSSFCQELLQPPKVTDLTERSYAYVERKACLYLDYTVKELGLVNVPNTLTSVVQQPNSQSLITLLNSVSSVEETEVVTVLTKDRLIVEFWKSVDGLWFLIEA